MVGRLRTRTATNVLCPNDNNKREGISPFIMTMQIDSRRTIGEVPILQVRRFFRQVVSHHQDSFNRQWLLRELRVSADQGDRVLEDLKRQGYISPGPSRHEDVEYQITELAHELVRASAAKRISRMTAQDALEGLMSSVKEVNANPKYLYSVRSVVLFGSYLNGSERLGDVDVAIELSSRIDDPNKRADAHLRYAQESGRQFGNFTDQLYWAEAEIYQVLKARRRTLSIQPWQSFLGMEKRKHFQYKVMLGDADKIARDLRAADEKRETKRTASS
jgi:predicted nucleotidyltransferase